MIKPVLKTFIFLEALFLISSHVSASSSERCCEGYSDCFRIEIPFLIMPLPDCPEGTMEPCYDMYTREHSETPRITYLGNMTKEMLTTKEYYFIVHGYTDNIGNPRIVAMKNALLKKDAATVILMDWRILSNRPYVHSASNTRSAGAHMAKVIDKIREFVNSPYVWCLGHSLGAHVCGQAGRKSQIDRITGLDPASPLIGDNLDTRRGLYTDSAVFVDVIHTHDFLGTYRRLGHADFYCNGGRRQPACGDLNIACHHSIVMDYFTESINSPCFLAKKCSNIIFFWLFCTPCTSCFPMGYDADPGNTGIFYLETNAESPYCKK